MYFRVVTHATIYTPSCSFEGYTERLYSKLRTPELSISISKRHEGSWRDVNLWVRMHLQAQTN